MLQLLIIKASWLRGDKSKRGCHGNLFCFCRDEATRTPDPYVPNVVRYQLRYIPISIPKVHKVDLFPLRTMQRYIFFLKSRIFFAKNLFVWLKSPIFALAIMKRYLSSGGRAMDWKSMCPWFNSKRYHFLLSFGPVFTSCDAGLF